MASIPSPQNFVSFSHRFETASPAFRLSSLAVLAPAAFIFLLPMAEALAGCTSSGGTVTCSGTTTAIDAPIAEVASGGTVTIEGNASASGSVGYAIIGTGGNTTLTNKGVLTTSGDFLDALETLGSGNVITNDGSIATSGNSANAIHAAGNGNTLLNDGSIDTGSGASARGMFAEGGGNILTNRGVITTNGAGAEALSADGNGNTLTNAGGIVTSGTTANGIRIHGNNSTILNIGTVTTSGIDGRGIKVDAGTGNRIVNRGTVSTSGVGAYGVWIASKIGETTTLLNEKTGTIHSQNDKALQFGAGNERTENFGILTTQSNGAAADLGAGQDYFLIGSTSQITGFVDANAGTDTFALGGKTNASFDASLIGPSSQYRNFEVYEKVGPSIWRADGDNGDVMPWSIREGGLMVTGSMGGSAMTVHAGATLGGTGTVGGIDTHSGSILSPGMNGIGSLAVTGNVLIANGTVYKIDLDSSRKSDRIVAQGSANVHGGTVQVNALPGDYNKPGGRWTILTAKGGVTGTFSNVTTNLAFFRPTLDEDSENIYLVLNRYHRPLPGGRPVIGPYLPVTEEELPDVLDQTSGQPIVSAMGTILVHDDLFRGAVLCRLRCSTGGLPTFTALESVTADYAADLPIAKRTADPIAITAPQRDWNMWAKAIGSWGSTESTATTHDVERSTAGLVFGVDAGLGTPYRLGLAAGYFSTDLDVASLSSAGNVESLHIGAYGSASFGAVNLRGGVAYAHHELDMTRSIAFTRFSGTTSSNSSVDSVQAFGELGYTIMLNDRVALEPFMGLAHVHVASRGVLEEGSVVAVAGDVESFDATYSTLGMRLIATMPTSAGALTFKGLLGWRHAFGDIVPKARFSYVGDGRPFLVTGAPIDKDSLVVEAGLNWEVSKSVTLSVAYSGAMGSRDREHTVRGGLSVRF